MRPTVRQYRRMEKTLFGVQGKRKHIGPHMSNEAKLATWWWSALPAPSSLLVNPDWYPVSQAREQSWRKRRWRTKGKRKVHKRGRPQGGCSDRRRTERLALSEAYQRKKALAAVPAFIPKGLDRGSPAQGPSTSTQISPPDYVPRPRFEGLQDPVVSHPSIKRNLRCHQCGEGLFYGWHVGKERPVLYEKHARPGLFLKPSINREWWTRWKDYTPP